MSRITPETVVVGIFAILVGLAGAYTARYYLDQEEVVVAPPPEKIDLPLASTELPAGKRLALGDIAIVPMTQQEMAERGLSTKGAMLNPDQIIGRILKQPLAPGEPFLATSLYPEGTGPSLSERLKPGLRAVTIEVEGSGLVNGFAGPGSVVDVLFRATSEATSSRGHAIPEATYTLVEGVEVLALGSITTPGTVGVENVSSVTLAVTPEQAAALKVVEGRGELSLALRATNETAERYPTQRVTIEQLLGLRQSPRPFVTEVYRGGSRQTITFAQQQVVEEEFGGIDSLLFSGPVSSEPSTPANQPTATDGATSDKAGS